jgi:nucleoid-associated protein YgaU
MADDPRFQQLKSKYTAVLNYINQSGARMQNLHVQDNKLFIRATVPTEDIKNKIWDQIKLVDPTYSDLTADIIAEAPARAASAAASTGSGSTERHYVVKPGDTLSKIAREFYGNANEYMKIFEANRNKLRDPNQIQAGQDLLIPA